MFFGFNKKCVVCVTPSEYFILRQANSRTNKANTGRVQVRSRAPVKTELTWDVAWQPQEPRSAFAVTVWVVDIARLEDSLFAMLLSEVVVHGITPTPHGWVVEARRGSVER